MKRILAALLALALACPSSAQVVNPGAGPGGSGYLAVYQANPSAALTGSVTETNLAAVRIPANSMGPNGAIRITAIFTYPNSANTKTISIRFTNTSGATSGGLILQNTPTTTASFLGMWFIRNANATGSQTSFPLSTVYGASTGTMTATTTDTTQDSFININGQLALGTETLTLVAYTVEVMHP